MSVCVYAYLYTYFLALSFERAKKQWHAEAMFSPITQILNMPLYSETPEFLE